MGLKESKAFGPRKIRQAPLHLAHFIAMGEYERSRSPAPGVLAVQQKDEPQEDGVTTYNLHDLQNTVNRMSAQLNSVDWMTASTTSLVHRDQELAASKQLLIMGWPAHMTEKDRDHEIKSMAHYYGVAAKLQGTTTLKTKQGISHFTIAEMWDKDSRNHFLQQMKADPHKIQDSTILGRPQIPRYRREQDAPLKCGMKSLAIVLTGNPKFRPSWELQAVWHDSAWVLAVDTDPVDTTKICIFVPAEHLTAFTTQFGKDWPTWQNQGSQSHRPQKYLKIRIAAFDQAKLGALDARFESMTNRSKDVEMNAPPDAAPRPPPAKGHGKGH